jgi:hypothetical protein
MTPSDPGNGGLSLNYEVDVNLHMVALKLIVERVNTLNLLFTLARMLTEEIETTGQS